MTATRALQLALLAAVALLFGACSVSRKQTREAAAVVAARSPSHVACEQRDRCAAATPLAELVDAANAANAAGEERHYVDLLDHGEDSLALRVHLIRAAQRSIDLQTFILSQDDAGFFVLSELLAAARRGVKVRVLTDQLFSIDNSRLLAQLARAHANFELRLYNPTFAKARTAPLEFAAGIVCCFFHFNQRMHNKLLLIDGAIGISGGRNIDNRYFDWSDTFNYRDRDVLVIGRATHQMQASFDIYWKHRTAVPLTKLSDVSAAIIADGDGALPTEPATVTRADRVLAVGRQADDVGWVRQHFVDAAFAVGHAEYFADLPNKTFERHRAYDLDLTARIGSLVRDARERITMQTPYLVLSRDARRTLRTQHETYPDLRIVVSTNSLASTDAFYVYAISHKYKRRYLKNLGFEIYEYKPFPISRVVAPPPVLAPPVRAAAPIPRKQQTSAEHQRLRRKLPVPLAREGLRRGMHAKSIVIDARITLIGSHNFDPRSDDLNTEAGVIVWDAAVGAAVEASIAEDSAPANSWVIAKRPEVPVVSEVNGAIATVSEGLPFFDLWPFRYATSYDLKPGCQPVSPHDPKFAECYEVVGDFPEVNLSLKQIYTRIIIAFGVGLVPIL